jgi:hypothetical protein
MAASGVVAGSLVALPHWGEHADAASTTAMTATHLPLTA